MLKTCLSENEKIYFYNSYKGKKYKIKNEILLSICYGMIVFAFLFLMFAFYFSLSLLLPFFIFSVIALIFFFWFRSSNEDYFKNNSLIVFECMITNKRILLLDKDVFLEIPFNSISFFTTRFRILQDYLGSLEFHFQNLGSDLSIHNDFVELSNNCLIIREVPNIYLIKNKISFIINNNITDISDIYKVEKFLDLDENILFLQDVKNTFKKKSVINLKNLIIFLFALVLLSWSSLVLETFTGSLPIFEPFLLIFVLGFIFKEHININSFRKKRNEDINVRYVITNKRVLFFDFNDILLYSFNLNDLDYVNVSNYDVNNNTGDVFISNKKYGEYIERLRLRTLRRDVSRTQTNVFEYFFPVNYYLHKISYKFDLMNCYKIRLYNVKDPNTVAEQIQKRNINS